MRNANSRETIRAGGLFCRFGLFPAPGLALSILAYTLVAVVQGCGGLSSGSRELEVDLEARGPSSGPSFLTDPEADRRRALIFNGLTRFSGTSGVVPDLAETVAVELNFRKFTFRLRSGIRFHNDQVLTSLDVRYTFMTMMRPDLVSDRGEMFRRLVESIDVPDERTVVFNCREPSPDFTRLVGLVGIIPEGTAGGQQANPIGTGPYRFVRYEGERRLRLRRNDDYFALERE